MREKMASAAEVLEEEDELQDEYYRALFKSQHHSPRKKTKKKKTPRALSEETKAINDLIRKRRDSTESKEPAAPEAAPEAASEQEAPDSDGDVNASGESSFTNAKARGVARAAAEAAGGYFLTREEVQKYKLYERRANELADQVKKLQLRLVRTANSTLQDRSTSPGVVMRSPREGVKLLTPMKLRSAAADERGREREAAPSSSAEPSGEGMLRC